MKNETTIGSCTSICKYFYSWFKRPNLDVFRVYAIFLVTLIDDIFCILTEGLEKLSNSALNFQASILSKVIHFLGEFKTN